MENAVPSSAQSNPGSDTERAAASVHTTTPVPDASPRLGPAPEPAAYGSRSGEFGIASSAKTRGANAADGRSFSSSTERPTPAVHTAGVTGAAGRSEQATHGVQEEKYARVRRSEQRAYDPLFQGQGPSQPLVSGTLEGDGSKIADQYAPVP